MVCLCGFLLSACASGTVLDDHTRRITHLEGKVLTLESSAEQNAKNLDNVDERLVFIERNIVMRAVPNSTGYVPSSKSTSTISNSTVSSPVASGPKGFYNTALNKYYDRNYKGALADFREFVRAYPTNALVPNALYWEGECHYALTDYREAIFSFKDVQTRFPEHAKVPDALLKTALVYDRLGDEGNKALHISALFTDWPESDATAKARQLGLDQ